jgi:hypothetical protein
MKSIIFWDMTSGLLSCNRRFGGTYRLHLQGWRNNFSKNQLSTCLRAGSCWNYVFDHEDGGDSFFETSVAAQQTTRRHIPEDDTPHNHRCENLKSYKPKACLPSVPGSSTKATGIDITDWLIFVKFCTAKCRQRPNTRESFCYPLFS